MKELLQMHERVKEEFADAKMYGEKAIHCKEMGNMADSSKYLEMSKQELGHAKDLHEMMLEKVKTNKGYYSSTPAIMDAWDVMDKYYMEEMAHVKMMLKDNM